VVGRVRRFSCLGSRFVLRGTALDPARSWMARPHNKRYVKPTLHSLISSWWYIVVPNLTRLSWTSNSRTRTSNRIYCRSNGFAKVGSDIGATSVIKGIMNLNLYSYPGTDQMLHDRLSLYLPVLSSYGRVDYIVYLKSLPIL
jgi:hypothetical protein